ncbi:MAG: EboA family metabolite traffic protein [Oculatellaceae cyanobacterium Prado106]|jgi:hypothetical protein|nr:EboA family metabolite traffic protein [Oculatellaceae cyanobacterium Prado106]
MQVRLNDVNDRLLHWLKPQVEPEALAWLEETRLQITQGTPERFWVSAFSRVPRYLGKQTLQLSPEDLDLAHDLRPGWMPSDWTVDQVGRTLLVLALPIASLEGYQRSLDSLFQNADVGEAIALYQSLPLLPYPELHCDRAAEGIRSNMAAVFNAVALKSPYPGDYLGENAWNQMILKAVFIGSSLSLIQGLDRRANPTLAQMLMDYAQERRAAQRSITPELWSLVTPFYPEYSLNRNGDMKRNGITK